MYSIIETIKQSARERKVLKILYQEKDGSIEGWRYIEPYSFSHDDGEEGLFAWDTHRKGIRRFSIERIREAQITDAIYEPQYKVEI